MRYTLLETLTLKSNKRGMAINGAPGVWGSWENGYLFSGSWGSLVIILRDLGSKLIVLGIKGVLPKS